MNPVTLVLSAMLAAQQPAGDAPADENENSVAAEAETQAHADDNKMVCRRTAVIGSKFKKKICATKKEWRTLQARSEETTKEMQRKRGFEPSS